jgi:hypothetical protein
VEAVAAFWIPDKPHTKQYIELALQESKRAHRVKKDTAGDIGTEVHSIVGAYVEGQLLPRDIEHPEKRKALENFMKVTGGWEWLGSEIVVINEWEERDKDTGEVSLFGYGGTADAIARLPDGKIYLIDFKTSNHISATYSMQCALYAAATPTNYEKGMVDAWRQISEARILHFNKEFLTWECLERNISEQMPYIPHFIGCRRWKKKFDQPNYSAYKDSKTQVKEEGEQMTFSSSR